MADMTWINILQIIGAASITGIFTLIGVWISQHGSAKVVKQTFETQRVLAQDVALRDYRKQQITPYLEAAKRRFRIWFEMYNEINAGDRIKLLELQKKMLDSDFNCLIITYVEIPDDTLRIAFQNFVNAEGELKKTYTKTEILEKIKQMRIALVDISAASERYLFQK